MCITLILFCIEDIKLYSNKTVTHPAHVFETTMPDRHLANLELAILWTTLFALCQHSAKPLDGRNPYRVRKQAAYL